MAITFNGLKNNLNDNQIPAGYVKPSVVDFADFEYKSTLNLTVLKSTVENANPATTMYNILNDATIGLTKQITDILAADYLATATVDAYAELIYLSNNYAKISEFGDFLTTTPASYECKILLYVKTA